MTTRSTIWRQSARGQERVIRARRKKLIARIFDRIEYLLEPELTYMGRPGLDPGTRELIENPYIIVYEVHEDRGEIVVPAIVHGAQKRKPRSG